MEKISIGKAQLDYESNSININGKSYRLEDLIIEYNESKLFSTLKITTTDKKYIFRKLKSIWEHLNLSTYDVLEKREDNKVFNLYCQIKEVE